VLLPLLLLAACASNPEVDVAPLVAEAGDDDARGAGGDTGAGDTGAGDDTEPRGGDTGPSETGSDTGFSHTDTTPPDVDTGAAETGAPDTGSPETGAEDRSDPALAALVVGRTYVFDLASARVTEPGSVGSLLVSYLGAALLVEVTGADATTIAVRWGWTDTRGRAQDTCAPTADATGAFTGTHAFATDPTAAHLWALEEMAGEEAVFSGTFSADGSDVRDATFRLLADTSGLAGFLGSDDPYEFCSLVASLGETCEACADGDVTCLPFAFTEMTGRDVSPLALVEVATPCPCGCRPGTRRPVDPAPAPSYAPSHA